jgi:ABC-type spermidine/putrescine transport system permease subunit II
VRDKWYTPGILVQAAMVGFLYIFLYLPIFLIIFISFTENTVWPFPPEWTLHWYEKLWIMSDFHVGFRNSLLIGLGTGALSTLLALFPAIGLLKFRFKNRWLLAVFYLAPLFIAHLILGIATLMFNRNILGLPGSLGTTIIANTTYGLSFAFLVILAQLMRYDWRMDEAAMVFGARPVRSFFEVTLPNIWPAVLGAFLVTFILAFNNLEISFYNLGATPTLPTIAWGTLRHGIEGELYALAGLINAIVFFILIGLFFLIRMGLIRFVEKQ